MSAAPMFVQRTIPLEVTRWGAPWGIAVTGLLSARSSPEEVKAAGRQVRVVSSTAMRFDGAWTGAALALKAGGMLLLIFPTRGAADEAVPVVARLACIQAVAA